MKNCRKLFKKNAGKKLEESAKLVISKKDLILIVLISAVFLIFCGIGRLWAQTDDCLWRNAIFRDMITHRWPVIYDRYDGALSYYIGAWLPAAFIGKLAYLFGAGTEAAFCVGNISFLIYYTFGMSILFLLLLSFFKTAKTEHIFLIVLGFIFFSGMDFAGNQFRVDSDQIEWWARTFQYSSFTTCMCWVYNQALIPWICTALLLHEKKVSDYVSIGMACLFAGPFPFIGYFVYCVALGIKRLVLMLKAKQGKEFAKEVFSISNICSILFIFPVVAAFLTSNTYMSSQDSGEPVFLPPTWCYENYVLYFLFLLIVRYLLFFRVISFISLKVPPFFFFEIFFQSEADLILYVFACTVVVQKTPSPKHVTRNRTAIIRRRADLSQAVLLLFPVIIPSFSSGTTLPGFCKNQPAAPLQLPQNSASPDWFVLFAENSNTSKAVDICRLNSLFRYLKSLKILISIPCRGPAPYTTALNELSSSNYDYCLFLYISA